MAVVHDLVLEPQARPLVGSVPVPADEAIAGLALLLGALGEGTSEVRRLTFGPDSTAMIGSLRALGVRIEAGAKGTVIVRGVGLSGLARSGEPVDCAGSARTMRLLAGALASSPFETVLLGDAEVRATGMSAVVHALRWRGAIIEGAFSATVPGEVTPPLVVGPLGSRRRLSGLEYELNVPEVDVKEALLVSGLSAAEDTYVRERTLSPDHAERMLDALGVPVSAAGPIVRFDVARFSGRLPGFVDDVPGDFTAAAFLLAAASLVPDSRVCARGTGLNLTRTGALYWLGQMGGRAETEVHGTPLGEPEGVACASHAPLRGVTMAGENLVRSGGEVGVLAALAARARGPTEIADLRLVFGTRVAPSSIGRFIAMLRAFGVPAHARDDGLAIEGMPERRLRASDVDSENDPNAAAMATLLGLVADGPTRVRRVDGLGRRFPRLVGTLRALGVGARVEERSV